jgi:hypothetical protein
MTLDVSPFIADSTLILLLCDDAPPVSEYHYYLQLVETSEGTTVALLSYLLVYPANSANTSLQLLLQDEDITFIHNKFWESMSLMILKALLIFSSTPSDLTQISLAWPRRASKHLLLDYHMSA